MKNTLIVNGRFICERMTGVQRTAWEILRAMSQIDNVNILVAVPKKAVDISALPHLDNVEYIPIGRFKKNMWEQVSLPRYCKKAGFPLLNMCNIAPSRYRSHVILHDIRCIDNKSYDSFKFRLYFKILLKSYIYKCKSIFTVSDYSKGRILANYPKLKEDNVNVICNGYEHILRDGESEIPNLPESFYLSVGSVMRHKNFDYIMRLAERNRDKNFVIVGNRDVSYEEYLNEHKIDNCIFTGHLSNEQLVFLYKKCKGFILPSLYEGFGIPPLEAIALGCRNIYLSDIPVFREIYDGCAKFFDPNNYENPIDLDDDIGDFDETAFEKLLEKYTWTNSAKTILSNIFNECGRE